MRVWPRVNAGLCPPVSNMNIQVQSAGQLSPRPRWPGTLPLAPLPGQICNVRGECALELETKIRADFTITEKSHIHISLP